MKKVFITGISSGIGKLIAKDLIVKNFLVIGVDVNYPVDFSDEIENKRLIFIEQDLRDTDAIVDSLNTAWNNHGKIDVVINNAAILNFKYLSLLTPDMVYDMIKVNLAAPVLITKFFLEKMINAKYGRIINISSVSAFSGKETTSIYATAKAGLNRFHQVVHREKNIMHKTVDVTINTLCPDRIATPEFLKANQKIPAYKLIKVEKILSIINQIIDSNVDGKIYKIPRINWRRKISEIKIIKKIPGLRWISNL